MAALEEVSDVPYSSNSLGRRGLQIRQKRQINVRRSDDVEAEDQCALAVPGGPSYDSSGSSPAAHSTPKYAPKLYVPEKKRTEGAVQHYDVRTGSPYGASTAPGNSFGSSYSGLGAADSHAGVSGGTDLSNLYSSRVIKGREPPAAPSPAESVLSTSRGLFKLRPKRVIRVKGLSEDSTTQGSTSGYSSSSAPSYIEKSDTSRSYGFIKDPALPRDQLARRGRQSVSDMLGSGSPASDISRKALQPAMYTPPVPALLPPKDVGSDMAVLQPVSDLFSRYESQLKEDVGPDSLLKGRPLMLETRHPPVGSEGNDLFETSLPQHIPGISKRKHSFSFLDDDDDVESEQALVPAPLEHPSFHQGSNGFMENGTVSETCNGDDSHMPGLMYPSVLDRGEQSVDHDLDARQETSLAVSNPFQVDRCSPLDRYQDRLASLKDQLGESRLVSQEIPQHETLDERKERILGNLYRQKFGVPSEPEIPATALPYETLAEKKEKIFANLRRKHSANLQAHDLLGLSSASPAAGVRPDFSRSLSLGATLGDKHSELVSTDIPHQQKGLSAFQPAELDTQETNPSHVLEESSKNGDNSAKSPGSFQLRSAATKQPLFSRNQSEYDNNSYANGNSSEGSRSQGQSPNEDMMSVDSGFHDPVTSESADREETDASEQQMKNQRPLVKKENGRKSPTKGPPFSQKNLKPVAASVEKKIQSKETPPDSVKPSDIVAQQKKKQGPPTKPKPQSHTPAHTPVQVKPRPKSAPPSKSKSTTNLVDVGLSLPRETRERSSSVAKDAEYPATSSFNRNSRLRSSTKAWEMRQAEQKQAKASSPPKVPPKPKPTPAAAKKSVVVGKVSLSEDRNDANLSKNRPHTPRNAGNYDKPWRTGSALAKSGSASPSPARRSSRSDNRERSNSSCSSSRASSPASDWLSRNRTSSTSEASSRTQSPSAAGNRSRRNSRDDILSSGLGTSPSQGPGGGKPPKNPVKDQGSVEQGCPRSPSPSKNSPRPSKLPTLKRLKPDTHLIPSKKHRDNTERSTLDSDNKSFGAVSKADISSEEYHSLLNLAAQWEIETTGSAVEVQSPDSAGSSAIADDVEVPLLTLDSLGTLDATAEEERQVRQWIQDECASQLKDPDTGDPLNSRVVVCEYQHVEMSLHVSRNMQEPVFVVNNKISWICSK